MKHPKVSIVVPLYKKTPYFYETIGRCLELDYPNFEILIGVDGKTKVEYNDPRIKVLRTLSKRTGPAEKRDIGIRKAKGEIIAFLDDDSYPRPDWLETSLKLLKSKKVDSVVGPGLTPPHDTFSQQVTGALLASPFGSGPYSYRFVQKNARHVDDYPAYNMIVTRSALKEIGGFGTKFYGGEDTAICIKLVNAGKKILYHPEVVVYHHRRRFPFEYAKQVGNVGLHRGYFVRKYPQTSLRPSYFGPAIFLVAFWTMAFASLFSPMLAALFLCGLVTSYLVLFFEGLLRNGFLVNVFYPASIYLNYFSYGWNFIKGLVFTKKLSR